MRQNTATLPLYLFAPSIPEYEWNIITRDEDLGLLADLLRGSTVQCPRALDPEWPELHHFQVPLALTVTSTNFGPVSTCLLAAHSTRYILQGAVASLCICVHLQRPRNSRSARSRTVRGADCLQHWTTSSLNWCCKNCKKSRQHSRLHCLLTGVSICTTWILFGCSV
jgi:hypothetical protein